MNAVYVYGKYASMQYSDVRTKYVPAMIRRTVCMNRRKGVIPYRHGCPSLYPYDFP